MKELKDIVFEVFDKMREERKIEQLVEEAITKAIKEGLNDCFNYSSEGRKLIEEKLQGVMVPFIESHDFNHYLIKVDEVLQDIARKTVIPHQKMLGNFSRLLGTEEIPEPISVRDIFKVWCEYVRQNIEGDKLEVDYDSGDSYEEIPLYMSVEKAEERTSIFTCHDEEKYVTFTCEADEEFNVSFMVYRWDFDARKEDKDSRWRARIEYSVGNLSSIKSLNDFEIFMLQLKQQHPYIKITTEDESVEEYVCPAATPEYEVH